MRHRKNDCKFNRNGSHRKAVFQNMIVSLIRYGIIKTTLIKAKELRRLVEPLITLSKIDNIANRRLVFAKIRNNEIVSKLFNDIGPFFLNRKGGYTRILKCGFRKGENSLMAYIELIDFVKFIKSKV